MTIEQLIVEFTQEGFIISLEKEVITNSLQIRLDYKDYFIIRLLSYQQLSKIPFIVDELIYMKRLIEKRYTAAQKGKNET